MAPALTKFDVISREMAARGVPCHFLRGKGRVFAVTQHRKDLLKQGRGLEAHSIGQMVRCVKGLGPMPRVDHRDPELRVAAHHRDVSRELTTRALALLKQEGSVADRSLRSGRKLCVRAAARRLRRTGLHEEAAIVETLGKAYSKAAQVSEALLCQYGPLFSAAPGRVSVC